MPKDPEQQTPEEKSHPVLRTGNSVLPFDIDEYLPKHQRTRAGSTEGRPEPAGYSIDDPTVRSRLLPARESLGATTWKVLTIAIMVLLVFGIVRFGVWSFQSSYPGTVQCYQIELWLHGVNSDLSRIQWALADSEEEIINETEAEEANDRIWKMFADMRTSLVRNQSPEEVAELKALWLGFLDLGFEIREANQKGDNENLNRLRQEQDEVLAQRLEEEKQVLRNCRLSDTVPSPDQVDGVGNYRNTQVAIRGAYFEGVV